MELFVTLHICDVCPPLYTWLIITDPCNKVRPAPTLLTYWPHEAGAGQQQSPSISPEWSGLGRDVKYSSNDLIFCWPGYIGGILVRYSCLDRFVNATETAKHYPLVDRFNGLIRTQMIRYFDWRLAPRCYLSTWRSKLLHRSDEYHTTPSTK